MKREPASTRTDRPKVVVMTDRMTADTHGRLAGIRRYLESVPNWQVHFLVGYNHLTVEEVRAALRDGASGFIVDICVNSGILDELARTNLPVVTIDVRRHAICSRPRNYVSICCDDEDVSRVAVRHFLGQSRFHSFGFVNAGITDEWAVIRERTFTRLLAEQGVSCASFKPCTPQTVHKDLKRWLRSLPKPAAVMAINDETAVDVLQAAAEAKIRVPQSLAVLGSDNDELVCENTTPTLSSIPPDFEAEGFIAAENLDRLLSSRTPVPARHLLVPLRPLVVRNSSASLTPADFLVRRALNFIDANACRGITVDDVVKHLHVSRRLLYLRFQETQDETIQSAIQNRRLAEVCKRLRATKETILEIAGDCGFPNVNYLMRLFKERYGMTMRTWRMKRHGCDNARGDSL